MIELSPETEALLIRLAAAQELSVDEAIRQALEAQAPSIEPSKPSEVAAAEIRAARRKAIDDMVATVAATPILDSRSPHEIMDDLDAL